MNDHLRQIIMLIGSGVSAIAALSLASYAFNIPALAIWAGNTPMALSTGIALLCVGVALVLVTIKGKGNGE